MGGQVSPVTFDTCFLIDLQREQRRRISGPARAFSENALTASALISVVALGEFARGFQRPDAPRLLQIISQFDLLPINRGIALRYSQISRILQATGTPIGTNDLWIAATAVEHDLPLVTRNIDHFRRVPDLKLLSYQSKFTKGMAARRKKAQVRLRIP
jgi:tRNA(fMet)-specific endonuclease VapC